MTSKYHDPLKTGAIFDKKNQHVLTTRPQTPLIRPGSARPPSTIPPAPSNNFQPLPSPAQNLNLNAQPQFAIQQQPPSYASLHPQNPQPVHMNTPFQNTHSHFQAPHYSNPAPNLSSALATPQTTKISEFYFQTVTAPPEKPVPVRYVQRMVSPITVVPHQQQQMQQMQQMQRNRVATPFAGTRQHFQGIANGTTQMLPRPMLDSSSRYSAAGSSSMGAPPVHQQRNVGVPTEREHVLKPKKNMVSIVQNWWILFNVDYTKNSIEPLLNGNLFATSPKSESLNWQSSKITRRLDNRMVEINGELYKLEGSCNRQEMVERNKDNVSDDFINHFVDGIPEQWELYIDLEVANIRDRNNSKSPLPSSSGEFGELEDDSERKLSENLFPTGDDPSSSDMHDVEEEVLLDETSNTKAEYHDDGGQDNLFTEEQANENLNLQEQEQEQEQEQHHDHTEGGLPDVHEESHSEMNDHQEPENNEPANSENPQVPFEDATDGEFPEESHPAQEDQTNNNEEEPHHETEEKPQSPLDKQEETAEAPKSSLLDVQYREDDDFVGGGNLDTSYDNLPPPSELSRTNPKTTRRNDAEDKTTKRSSQSDRSNGSTSPLLFGQDNTVTDEEHERESSPARGHPKSRQDLASETNNEKPKKSSQAEEVHDKHLSRHTKRPDGDEVKPVKRPAKANQQEVIALTSSEDESRRDEEEEEQREKAKPRTKTKKTKKAQPRRGDHSSSGDESEDEQSSRRSTKPNPRKKNVIGSEDEEEVKPPKKEKKKGKKKVKHESSFERSQPGLETRFIDVDRTQPKLAVEQDDEFMTMYTQESIGYAGLDLEDDGSDSDYHPRKKRPSKPINMVTYYSQKKSARINAVLNKTKKKTKIKKEGEDISQTVPYVKQEGTDKEIEDMVDSISKKPRRKKTPPPESEDEEDDEPRRKRRRVSSKSN